MKGNTKSWRTAKRSRPTAGKMPVRNISKHAKARQQRQEAKAKARENAQ